MKNNKGMAMLEALPIIMVMFVLMGATLGSWGIVHTAILNSISARNLVFFYFNNRSDLSYLRDFSGDDYGTLGGARNYSTTEHYFRKDVNDGIGKRYFYIWAEGTSQNSDGMFATLRRVDFRNPKVDGRAGGGRILSGGAHSNIESITTPNPRNTTETGRTSESKSKAWIMVGYGICLDSHCGQ